MEAMTVLSGFDEYEDGKLVSRKKGDDLTVSNDRAEQLRAAGLARSKPKPKPEPKAEAPRTDPDTPSRG